MAFKMKTFSGFGNSPMKKTDKVSKKPTGMLGRVAKAFGVKKAAKRIGLLGTAMSIYDVAKTAKKAMPGLKRRAKSGNVNIGRKI